MIANSFDVRTEAHVEHAIRLVKNEKLNVAEVDNFLVDKVLQATGSRHQDVAPVGDAVPLVAHLSTAVQNHGLENGVVRELARLAVNLDGQLARG